MGTNSSTEHATYSVAPGAETDTLAPDPQTIQPTGESLLALQQLAQGGPPGTDEKLVAAYGQLQALTHAAKAELAPGADPTAIKDAAAAWLNQLDDQQLQLLATHEGMQGAHTLGLSPGKNPLHFWLDPYYDANLPQKNKIAQIAQQRLAEEIAESIAAGKSVAAPAPPESPSDAVLVTEEQALGLYNDVHLKYLSLDGEGSPSAQQVKDFLAAEESLLRAECPQIASELHALKVAGAYHVDHVTGQWEMSGEVLEGFAQCAGERTGTDPEAVKCIQAEQLRQLARRPVDGAEKPGPAVQEAKDRYAQLLALHEGMNAFNAFNAADKIAKLPTFAASAIDLAQKHHEVLSWAFKAAFEPTEALVACETISPKDHLDAALKSASASTVCQTAIELGLPLAVHASKPEAAQYIVARYNAANHGISAENSADVAEAIAIIEGQYAKSVAGSMNSAPTSIPRRL